MSLLHSVELPASSYVLERTNSETLFTCFPDFGRPYPSQRKGGSLRRELLPEFLVYIAQSEDTKYLLQSLNVLKDGSLEAATVATNARDRGLPDLHNALQWVATEGTVQAVTAITGVWTPQGLLLTATVTVAYIRLPRSWCHDAPSLRGHAVEP